MHKHHKHKEANHGQHGASRAAAELKAPEPRAHNQTSAENGEHASPRADASTKLQWANLGLQLIILAVTAAILWVYFRQLQSMLASNELTRQSLVETKNSNASSSRTAERALKLTEESNRLTREALEESKRQSEASRKQSARDAAASLSESRRQSAASLKLAKDTLRLSEGASINIENVRISLETQPFTVTATARNVGRSPAENLSPTCMVALWTHPKEKAKFYTAYSVSFAPIGPGQEHSFGFTLPSSIMNGDLIAALKSERAKMQIFIDVSFDDRFGDGEAISCYYYAADRSGMYPCKQSVDRQRKLHLMPP